VKNIRIMLFMAFTILIVLTVSRVTGSPKQIIISSPNSTRRVGEPLIMKATFIFKEPIFSPVTSEPQAAIHQYMKLYFLNEDGSKNKFDRLTGRKGLYREDDKGQVYSNHFLIFWNEYIGLYFDEPGSYIIQAEEGKVFSNPLEIQVIPGRNAENRALSILKDADPNVHKFILFGRSLEHKKNADEILSTASKIIDECSDTVLGKLSAANLGLKYFADYRTNVMAVESAVEFIRKYRQNKITKEKPEEAHKYLSKAVKLADEFPVREEVLYRIAHIDFIKGNYENASKFLDGLAEKYPKGRYGRRVPRIRSWMERLKKQLSE